MNICSIEGCESEVFVRGMCATDYGRAYRVNKQAWAAEKAAKREAKSKTPRVKRRVGCKIPGCEGDNKARGLCRVHYRQASYQGTLDEIGDPSMGSNKARANGLHVGPHGYIWRQMPGRRVFEHRWVMEQHLGRKLERWETVHHKDGDKANNELDNLELFSAVPQSAGQRPVDMATYLLEKHPEILREFAAQLVKGEVA